MQRSFCWFVTKSKQQARNLADPNAPGGTRDKQHFFFYLWDPHKDFYKEYPKVHQTMKQQTPSQRGNQKKGAKQGQFQPCGCQASLALEDRQLTPWRSGVTTRDSIKWIPCNGVLEVTHIDCEHACNDANCSTWNDMKCWCVCVCYYRLICLRPVDMFLISWKIPQTLRHTPYL